MSVSGYLVPGGPVVRRAEGCDSDVSRIADDFSMILGMEMPVEQIYKDAIAALESARLEGESLPGGLIRRKCSAEYYPAVQDYDPVLLWHCRLSR